jgi:hypothetical protein
MKFKLDTGGMEDDFFEDTRLLGIVAPMKDYLLCWQLNQIFRFKFRINNGIEIQLNKKHRNFFFNVYEYCEPHCSLTHYLYNNEHDGEYLLPEFKHLDYLWLMKGDPVHDETLSHMVSCIKNINGVQLVSELTNEKIRNKGHLIF